MCRYVASGRGRARTVALLLADSRTAADAATVEGDTALVVRVLGLRYVLF